MHALLCLGAYAMTGWLNTYSWLGSFGLLYEASTPFMHLRMTLVALKRANGALFHACNVGFGLTYLIVRIGGGAYFAYTGLNLVLAEQCVALPYQVFATIIILGTCGLNCFWCAHSRGPRAAAPPPPREVRPGHPACASVCAPLSRFSLIVKAARKKPRKPEGGGDTNGGDTKGGDTKPKAA